MHELSLEQRHLNALQLWQDRGEQNPPSLSELIAVAYPERDDIDGRSKEARELKIYLAQHGVAADGAHVYHAKSIELSDDQKEFIENNASLMSAVHLARVIFEDETITNLHAEARAVNDYLQTLDPSVIAQDTADVPDVTYVAPKSFDKTFIRANLYIAPKIDKKKISPKHRRGIEALMGYLNTYRFIHQIETYTTNTDRILYESCFVRYTYDKSDLSQEEVDQYIVLATEVVIGSTIQARSERLQQLLDVSAEDTEGRRVAMGLVQAISAAQTEYNQCIGRQHKLLSDLKEKRSDKLKNQIRANASIINLIEIWKEEESRLKLIKLAELRKKAIKAEVKKLTTMDEVKARVMGISEDEILNG
jgi:hypothetical protein